MHRGGANVHGLLGFDQFLDDVDGFLVERVSKRSGPVDEILCGFLQSRIDGASPFVEGGDQIVGCLSDAVRDRVGLLVEGGDQIAGCFANSVGDCTGLLVEGRNQTVGGVSKPA
mgnify:CR=1 FL=1